MLEICYGHSKKSSVINLQPPQIYPPFVLRDHVCSMFCHHFTLMIINKFSFLFVSSFCSYFRFCSQQPGVMRKLLKFNFWIEFIFVFQFFFFFKFIGQSQGRDLCWISSCTIEFLSRFRGFLGILMCHKRLILLGMFFYYEFMAVNTKHLQPFLFCFIVIIHLSLFNFE